MKKIDVLKLVESCELCDKDKIELSKRLVLEVLLNTGIDILSEAHDKLDIASKYPLLKTY